MAVFDLSALNPPINVSSLFQSVIQDEFTSTGDSDSILNNIRQRFVVPKVVSNDKYVIIVFAGRYSTDNQWKIYLTYAIRPDGEFSTPIRIYDPGDDSIYQLAPSLALSETDLYITWQERNRDTHPNGETEWNIMYGRFSLSDFTLKDIKNAATYSSSNLDKSAFMAPDIALTPKSNVYDGNGNLLMQDCIVHISFENATWTNLTPGGRNNEDINDLFTNIYYTNLSSSYFGSTFNTPEIINDLVTSPGEGGGGGGSTSYIKSIEYVETEVTGIGAALSLTKSQTIDNCIPFMTKAISSSTSDDWDDIMLDVYFEMVLIDIKMIPAVIVERSQSGGSVRTGIFVVEFDPTYINVQQGIVSFSDTSDTDPITPVDLSKTAMLFYYKHLNDQDDWDDLRMRGWFSADDTISWERDSSSGDVYGHFYVFEAINDEFSVQSTSFSIGDGQTSNIGSITTAVNTSKSMVLASFESTNANHNPNDGSCDVWLENSTSVKAQRYDNDNVIYIDAFVIEFNGEEEVQRGIFNYAVDDGQESVNIDPINLNSSIVHSSVCGGQIRASQAASTDVMRAWQKLKFLDSDTIQGETHIGGGNEASGHWEVIDWNFAGGPCGTVPNNRINFNGNLETPQIVSQVSSNYSIILENSTEISVNFNQTNYKEIVQLDSISIKDYSGQEFLIFCSEQDFIKKFGQNSLLFDQNKIIFPDDLQFHDMYDTRTFYFGSQIFTSGTLEYELSSFFYDNASLVRTIKDVYYSSSLLNVYQIESDGTRLNRNNYSIFGDFGTEGLNITFTHELPLGSYFYVKYSLDEYLLPQELIVEVSTIKNEVGFIFETYTNSTNRDIYLDVSNTEFQFQSDILLSNGTSDKSISRQGDIKYDYDDLLNIIYSGEVNNSFSRIIFKHTRYNSSSGLIDVDKVFSDPINFSNYDYYRMLNPIVNLDFNNSLFIAYETNFKETGQDSKWKVQYSYLDLNTEELIGPFYVKTSDSSQERSPDAYWSDGLFWTFTTNSSSNMAVEYTSSRRVDLNSFSTLAADFMPIIYNQEAFCANMSIYFNIDLSSFANDLLETEDQVRFIVSLEEGETQYILLDTGWNDQTLNSWIENNLATYYPRYLRYYYDLSLSSLTFSGINATDDCVQTEIYPFELRFPYPVNFTEHFNLRFNLVKDDWSLNQETDLDRFQVGIDIVDISFEIMPTNYTENTFGIITRSEHSSSYSMSEFVLSNKINLEDLDFLSDPNLYYSDDNKIDLLIDFDAFSLLYDPISELQIPPASDLECKLMIMVENDNSPDLTIADELLYDSWVGHYLGNINLKKEWQKDFGKLYYSLDLQDYTIDIYNKYYSTFYNKGYKWFMNDFKLYLKEDPTTSYPEFWYWYTTTYLPQTIYPFLDSLRWNQL